MGGGGTRFFPSSQAEALDSPAPRGYDVVLKTRLPRRITPYVSLIATILLLCLGQLLAKEGARLRATGSAAFWILAAAYASYLLRAGTWVAALRRLPLSLAYPLLATAYPLIMLLSAFIFGEPISVGRILASLLIGSGVLLIGTGKGDEHGT